MMELIEVNPKEIIYDELNPNVMDSKTFKALTNEIKKNGFIQPVVIREREGQFYVIDGEHRVEAAKILGLEKIPAVNLGDVDDEKARILLVNLNRLKGEFSPYKFAELIEELEKQKIDLQQAIYMDEKELDTYRLLRKLEEDNIEDVKTIIESGEVEVGEKITLKSIEIDGLKNIVIDRENKVVKIGDRKIPVNEIKTMRIDFTKKLEAIFHLELKYSKSNTQNRGENNE